MSTAAQQREAKARGSLTTSCPSPTEFAPRVELVGNKREFGYDGVYALADTGTEEDFEEALSEAREEGNVFVTSRRHSVGRECRSSIPFRV